MKSRGMHDSAAEMSVTDYYEAGTKRAASEVGEHAE